MNQGFVRLAAFAALFAAAPGMRAGDGIEPGAGGWHTWVIQDVMAYRLPPPPDQDTTSQELQDVKAMVESRDAGDLQQIAFWNAGTPAYRWIQIAQQEVNNHGLGGPA